MSYFPVERVKTIEIGHFLSSELQIVSSTIRQNYQLTQVDLERPDTGRPISAKIICSYCQEEVEIILLSRFNLNLGRLGVLISLFLFPILLGILLMGVFKAHTGTVQLLFWLNIVFIIISLIFIDNDGIMRKKKNDPHSQFYTNKKK